MPTIFFLALLTFLALFVVQPAEAQQAGKIPTDRILNWFVPFCHGGPQ